MKGPDHDDDKVDSGEDDESEVDSDEGDDDDDDDDGGGGGSEDKDKKQEDDTRLVAATTESSREQGVDLKEIAATEHKLQLFATVIEEESDDGKTEQVNTDEEKDEDDMESICEEACNTRYRPFRNDPKHINAHRVRSSDSMCSMSSTGSSIDPALVKRKVASQLKMQRMRQLARRTRKRGEASCSTANRRDLSYNVQASLSAEWYDCDYP